MKLSEFGALFNNRKDAARACDMIYGSFRNAVSLNRHEVLELADGDYVVVTGKNRIVPREKTNSKPFINNLK